MESYCVQCTQCAVKICNPSNQFRKHYVDVHELFKMTLLSLSPSRQLPIYCFIFDFCCSIEYSEQLCYIAVCCGRLFFVYCASSRQEKCERFILEYEQSTVLKLLCEMDTTYKPFLRKYSFPLFVYKSVSYVQSNTNNLWLYETSSVSSEEEAGDLKVLANFKFL